MRKRVNPTWHTLIMLAFAMIMLILPFFASAATAPASDQFTLKYDLVGPNPLDPSTYNVKLQNTPPPTTVITVTSAPQVANVAQLLGLPISGEFAWSFKSNKVIALATYEIYQFQFGSTSKWSVGWDGSLGGEVSGGAVLSSGFELDFSSHNLNGFLGFGYAAIAGSTPAPIFFVGGKF